ncbi:MAG: hypothetical protein FJ102_23990 [Deltaproteobacteria bacterium]|nr:hypothetical protein [Deltaproteobacteria bacterium]
MGQLGDLIAALGELASPYLPAWARWGLVGAAVLLLLLGLRRTVPADNARRRYARAARLPEPQRAAEQDAALASVQDNANGLLAIAQLALAAGRIAQVEAALARLRLLRAYPEEVLRLQRQVEGPQPGTPLEAALIVERFLERGQFDEARSRLARYQSRWPRDEDLAALAPRCAGDET